MEPYRFQANVASLPSPGALGWPEAHASPVLFGRGRDVGDRLEVDNPCFPLKGTDPAVGCECVVLFNPSLELLKQFVVVELQNHWRCSTFDPDFVNYHCCVFSLPDESPYLQIGECKYGRPILDRGICYDRTSLEEAAKYALISLDSTMRSNTTVGPPIDLALYTANELHITRYRRFNADDPDLGAIRVKWEQALRKTVQELPTVRFDEVKL